MGPFCFLVLRSNLARKVKTRSLAHSTAANKDEPEQKKGFSNGIHQLCRRFGLLVFSLRIAYPSWSTRSFVAEGKVLAPWIQNARPTVETTEIKIGPLAIAHITCEEIESFE